MFPFIIHRLIPMKRQKGGEADLFFATITRRRQKTVCLPKRWEGNWQWLLMPTELLKRGVHRMAINPLNWVVNRFKNCLATRQWCHFHISLIFAGRHPCYDSDANLHLNVIYGQLCIFEGENTADCLLVCLFRWTRCFVPFHCRRPRHVFLVKCHAWNGTTARITLAEGHSPSPEDVSIARTSCGYRTVDSQSITITIHSDRMLISRNHFRVSRVFKLRMSHRPPNIFD